MKTGFSLAEILITLVILGFVGALGVPMLGAQKLKKPQSVKAKHGTMECFWENDRLMQYTANNTENKNGELKDVTAEGACYITVPTANLYVIQAVGAGGMGAAGMSGPPHYRPATKDVNGSIPTDTNFLTSISDTKNVPDWVRKEWNEQWKYNERGVQYTLRSPVGAGGNGACDKRRKDTTNGVYNDCSDLCTTGLEYLCPDRCTITLDAEGGKSGMGAEYIVSIPLKYSPDGQKDSVSYTYNYQETKLEVGGNSVILPSSKAGQDGRVNYPYDGMKKDGENAPSFDFYKDAQITPGFNIIRQTLVNNRKNGGTGCAKISGEGGIRGNILDNYPKKIPYSTQSLAIEAYFGVAGSAGESTRKVLEKIPDSTQFKLIPVKNNTDGEHCKSSAATCSKIFIKKNDEWELFMEAASGSDGWSGTMILPVEEGDLPFPKEYLPYSFRAAIPQLSIASGAGYKSYLAKNNNSDNTPGASGRGAYPLVKNLSGSAVHRINGYVTGNENLKPLSMAEATCDSLLSGSGTSSSIEKNGVVYHIPETCGEGNSPGRTGAAIISW